MQSFHIFPVHLASSSTAIALASKNIIERFSRIHIPRFLRFSSTSPFEMIVISSEPSKEMLILGVFAVNAAVSDHNSKKENKHVAEWVCYSTSRVDNLAGLKCLSNCLSIQYGG